MGKKCFCSSGLIEFNCPNSVTAIPNNCFDKCSELKKVRLSNQVKKLGFCAFMECFNLQDIMLPESVLEIEAFCFARTKIKTIIFPRKVKKISGAIFGNNYTKKPNYVICVFLGKETIIEFMDIGNTVFHASLIYCLPGSNILQFARERSIPTKPLSEFSKENIV